MVSENVTVREETIDLGHAPLFIFPEWPGSIRGGFRAL